MITDNRIMRWFHKGFSDHLRQQKRELPKPALLVKAYQIGIAHAHYGDDMPTIDYRSREQVITEIRNSNHNQ